MTHRLEDVMPGTNGSAAEGRPNLKVTAEVARRARELRFEDLPSGVVRKAQHCVLDWLGVTVAGASAPATTILRENALAEGGSGIATLIGTGERVTRAQAALVNGTGSHVLDYDDVSSAMGGHPSVTVLPALFAVAEEGNLSGAAFLTAFVAGFETECRVGRLVAPDHYARGFHTTGTVGTFGAAAACAHVLGLDDAQWRMALGIAGTQAAGLKSMFGTMCKPLHAGKAALNGMTAAVLAAQGFTAHPEVLDVPQGFATTQSNSINPARALEHDTDGFDLPDVLFKFHAACYLTHSSIEGLLRLREEHGFDPKEVASVELRVPVGHLSVCNIPNPTTPLEGKFSLRFTSALALARGDVTEHAFTQEALSDPDLVALRDRVIVIPEAERTQVTGVTVRLIDGLELTAAVDVFEPTPESELEREWARLHAKFLALVGPVLGVERARTLADAVARLPEASSLHPLVALTSPV